MMMMLLENVGVHERKERLGYQGEGNVKLEGMESYDQRYRWESDEKCW